MLESNLAEINLEIPDFQKMFLDILVHNFILSVKLAFKQFTIHMNLHSRLSHLLLANQKLQFLERKNHCLIFSIVVGGLANIFAMLFLQRTVFSLNYNTNRRRPRVTARPTICMYYVFRHFVYFFILTGCQGISLTDFRRKAAEYLCP